jgi:NADH dehydrogenase
MLKNSRCYSLILFGDYKAVGSLFIEGLLACLMIMSLYKMHLLALHGYFNLVLDTTARFLKRRTGPRAKLH